MWSQLIYQGLTNQTLMSLWKVSWLSAHDAQFLLFFLFEDSMRQWILFCVCNFSFFFFLPLHYSKRCEIIPNQSFWIVPDLRKIAKHSKHKTHIQSKIHATHKISKMTLFFVWKLNENRQKNISKHRNKRKI